MIDGEIIIATDHGLDFEALQQRIHPADSRVRMLAEQTPASFIAFDLLALGDDDYTRRPFSERRAALVDALAGSGPSFHVTPATTDLATAQRWFEEFEGAGLDGVDRQAADDHLPARQARHVQDQARADRRLRRRRLPRAQVRQRRNRLAAARALQGRRHTRLGRRHRRLPDGQATAAIHRVAAARHELRGHPWNWAAHEAGGRTPRRNEGSRWNAGKDLSFVPLRPERVVEVRYDHMEGERFRHTAQFNRWRPDRDPRSCTYTQLQHPLTFSLGDIVPGLGPGNG